METAIFAELASVIEKGLPEVALEKARRGAIVSEVNSRKTMAGQASRLGLAEVMSSDFVRTARAKGLAETRVIMKYPVRAAMNPFASTIGYLFPFLVSGSISWL